MNNKIEYILCAAILRINERDFTMYHHNDLRKIEIGYRHADIYRRFEGEVDKSPKAQGFYTSKGRFVNRKEAMEIAYNAGQVSIDVAKFDGEFRNLFSEDLY
jgi:hypothetical protein